jgi:hypothetical protein
VRPTAIIGIINTFAVFALAVYLLPGWLRSLTMLLVMVIYMVICFV